MENFKITFFDEAKEDYRKLEGNQRLHVDKALERIKEYGMATGEALVGNLSGCRKLKHKRLGLRIVFKQSGASIEIIEIIAIGKRDKKQVYKDSQQRIEKNKLNKNKSQKD